MSEVKNGFSRFSLSERVQHGLLLITVTLLALTGLPQKYSSLEWARPMVELMGGIYVVRIIHRVSAAVLTLGVLYHVVYGLYHLLVKRAHFDMLPRLKDFRDFIGNIAYFLGLKRERPRFDRFNYIEKFEYWAVLWGMAVMAVTGLLMWFPVIATRLFPGIVVPSAKAMHSGEALLAISAVILWHMYNAHLSPRVFPFNRTIFTGRQSAHEMMSEHPLEYERRTGLPVSEKVLQVRPDIAWSTLAVSGAVGLLMIGLFSAMFYWMVRPPSPRILPPIHAPLDREVVRAPMDEADSGFTKKSTDVSMLWKNTAGGLTVADFLAEPVAGPLESAGSAGMTYQFTDQSSPGVTSWLWDFGDGHTSREQNPLHVYVIPCPGKQNSCTVSLTACGPGGCDTRIKPAFVQLASE
jgi:formate dehydrogenase subunit gamma